MSSASSTSDHLPTFDGIGRLVPLTETEIRKRNLIALAALDAIQQIGDEVEQRETLDYLRQSVDDDRLSERRRFQP